MLWRKRVTALAQEYPDVELSHMYVDNAAMQLIRYPKQVCLWNKLTSPYSQKKNCLKDANANTIISNTEFCSSTLL